MVLLFHAFLGRTASSGASSLLLVLAIDFDRLHCASTLLLLAVASDWWDGHWLLGLASASSDTSAFGVICLR